MKTKSCKLYLLASFFYPCKAVSGILIRVALLAVILMGTGTKLLAATITTTAQGGLWSEKTTWVGGVVPTKTDNVVITSLVTTGDFYYSSGTHEMNSLTIQQGGKIIREKEKAGRLILKINGNLVNHGEIIDYKDFLDISIFGDLVNHGTLKPRIIYLDGANQHITTTKPVECQTFNLNMSDKVLTANSDLLFHNCQVTSSSTVQDIKLIMSKHVLRLSADSIKFDYGEARSAMDLRIPVFFDGTGTIICDMAVFGGTINGDVKLQSPSLLILKKTDFMGNLTITEGTKITSQSNLLHMTVNGNFYNYGRLNADSIKTSNGIFAPRSMYLNINGNAYNYGTTGISSIVQNTNGKTLEIRGTYTGDVKLQQAPGTATPGGKVIISDQVTFETKLDLYTTLEIAKSGNLYLPNQKIWSTLYVRPDVGELINHGTLHRYHYVNNSWSYRSFNKQPGTFVDFELREWDGRIEGVEVEVHNGASYPGLTGSSHRWWRLTPIGEGKVKYFTVKFYYDQALLNGQKEENLKVYRSMDEGKTWEVISIGEHAVLNTVDNSISIGVWNKNESMLSDFGIFVISAGDGSVPIPSPIIVDVVGSPNIRLGAPNRYTVHLYNVGDSRTESFYTVIAISKNIVFNQIEIPTNNGKIVFPIDSIGTPKDDMQFFHIPYLEPNEHYSFDVIVTGVHDGTKSASLEETYITAAGVINDMRDRFIKDGWTGVLHNYQLKELNAEEQAKLDEKVKQMLKQIETDKKKEGSGAVAQAECLKRIFENMGFPAKSIHWLGVNIGTSLELLDRTTEPYRQSVWNWLNNQDNSTENEEIKLVHGKLIKGKIVNSWDPNEIVGPAGYGDKNFISSIPVMNYTIMFENLKEATAPAYRVQIVDTLSALFNAETVQFKETSHSGVGYNWKMERKGNILKWDIEGIELPPNVTPPEGEGFVRFSVELRDGLPSGTVIENRAAIIFDINPPIITNTWVNILDFDAPTTVMNAINYSVGDTLVNVSCSSTDKDGAGIAMYEFFVSVDGAPFASLGQTVTNSKQYSISKSTKNHYRFYAIVTDNVFNRQKSVPEYADFKSLLVNAPLVYNSLPNFEVYPNPANDLVHIGFMAEHHSRFEINLYSINGSLLKTSTREWIEPGQHRFTLDISELNSGIYFIETRLDGKPSVFKLVKQP